MTYFILIISYSFFGFSTYSIVPKQLTHIKKRGTFLASRSNKVFGVTRELENTKKSTQNADILGIILIVLFLLVAKLLLEMRIMLKRFFYIS